eukprot:TRINITY_DN23172_c0_g1_i2.p1 TRINITY_DN23172_c0_g1~~TRINITY_DN23172_c0_g1_i2.p1  ORF type:complete len:313 (+),score=67.24 TRINITY_DN23172_c0_g1_i2:98-1036(+)
MTPVEGGVASPTLAAPWPQEDILRLMRCLAVRDCARLAGCDRRLRKRLQAPVAELRRSEAEPAASAEHEQVLEMTEALHDLEHLLDEATCAAGGEPLPSLSAALEQLSALEAVLHTEMRYVHGPDWEMKPGRLITRKGTWLKHTTRFSWEIPSNEKLYLPEGVALPVLQIGRVVDKNELKLHEWSSQHLRVWLKPSIVRSIESRNDYWFVYWPHFDHEGTVVVAAADTWLKRSCQMSGELQPFELIYVPKGVAIHLAREPELVDEEWEVSRHAHIHQHRKLLLAAPPLTMRRDKYDIFIGQPEDKLPAGAVR